MAIYVENEANDEEDTNESSRLLISTTMAVNRSNPNQVTHSSSSQNYPNYNNGSHDKPTLLSSLNEIASEQINLENQITTSIESGSGQMFLSGCENNSEILPSINHSIMTKYGSISSINQVPNDFNIKINQACLTRNKNFDNFTYQVFNF